MIGIQIKAWREGTEVKYELNEKLKHGDLAEASLLLAALHIAEKDLVQYIDDCEPDLHISED